MSKHDWITYALFVFLKWAVVAAMCETYPYMAAIVAVAGTYAQFHIWRKAFA